MQITPKHTISAVAAIAALCAPAAAYAHGGSHGNGLGHGQRNAETQQPQDNQQPPDNQQSQDNQQAPDTHRGPRWRTVIVAGTVASVDGDVVTVQVRRANRHGRALRNQQVQLDVSSARLRVKDANSDGTRDATDVAAGDRVLAQVRVPRGTTLDLTQPIATRILVDVGPAPSQSANQD